LPSPGPSPPPPPPLPPAEPPSAIAATPSPGVGRAGAGRSAGRGTGVATCTVPRWAGDLEMRIFIPFSVEISIESTLEPSRISISFLMYRRSIIKMEESPLPSHDATTRPFGARPAAGHYRSADNEQVPREMREHIDALRTQMHV